MNIKGFYIPDRPFCIHCGFEDGDVDVVRKHIEEFHFEYHCLQSGIDPEEEPRKDWREDEK